MKYAFAPAIVFALFFPFAAPAITITTVPVGNPGNTGRVDGVGIFGAVANSYRIATTEVTNAQYVEFLNAVAASDPNGLYNSFMGSASSRGGIVQNGASGSFTYSVKPDAIGVGPGGTNYTYGNKPVVYVSWFDAARFANWVNNGGTATSSTETGAYTMSAGIAVPRNTSTATWFLPSENEWYKAAYYDGSTSTYYNYATKSNDPPDNHAPSSDSGNSADYHPGSYTLNASYPYTPVGAYTLSKSPYGTFDQDGNVWEWTDTLGANNTRIRRGGAFDTDATKLISSYREGYGSGLEIESVGFRLATIATAAGVPGDYNNNGVVDAADYILWRKFNGNPSITLPNDSTTGTDANDYTVWRSHFGQTSAGAGSGSLAQTSVPEPSASLLGLIGLISLICFGRSQIFATSRSPRLY